jgi:hypothetical protein
MVGDGSMNEQESRRELEPVADVLDVVLGRFAGTPQGASLQIFERWDAVAGSEWQHTTPVKIDEKGVLVVDVPDGGAATRLRFESDALVAAIERELGEGLVSGIRLRVARNAG